MTNRTNLSRRDFLALSTSSIAAAAMPSCFAAAANPRKKTHPNILWLSCEDLSPHLGCYGYPNAVTPNLDAFAQTAVRYDRAFTVHGVCSPSRTGIITAMYPSSLGANHHRSRATVPAHVRCLPEYLRDAGYYTTNNSKEDYNFKRSPDAWDQSNARAHYKNRHPDAPFFAVFNFVETHESRIWNSADLENTRPEPLTPDQYQDPARMTPWPFHPDAPDTRRDWARVLERTTQWDYWVKDHLDALDQAGLADDTIVFIWSDHGTALPRGKRWTYDTGTLSILMVRVPEKFRSPGQAAPGSTDSSLINFIDLGPTTLNLAGLPLPDHFQGQPFLGPNLPQPRQYIFGARDRIDEGHDFVRSVRTDRYRYVRHYLPFLPRILRLNYSLKCNTLLEMIRLHDLGQLPPAAAKLMEMHRDPEELFDLDNDPYEMNNLANDPAHAATRDQLRSVLNDWLLDIRDTGFLPEPELHRRGRQFPSFHDIFQATADRNLLSRIIQTADLALEPTPETLALLRRRTNAPDPAVRHWALVGLAAHPDRQPEDLTLFETACLDANASVRLIAAWRILDIAPDRADRALQAAITEVENPESDFSQHLALEVLEYADQAAQPLQPRLQAARPNLQYSYSQQICDRLLQNLK